MTAPAAADPGDAIPRLAERVELLRQPDGVVRLRGPLHRRGRLHRLIAWLVRAPQRMEVELDDIGTWVVERMDGRPLALLAEELAAHLKLTRREARAAIGDFVRLLLRRRLLDMHDAGTQR